MARILRLFFGYLRVRIWGLSPERFLNLCAGRGIFLWNLKRNGNNIELCMKLKSFYELRPLARKTGVRVAILQRIGLPFFLRRIRNRWPFLLGGLLAVAFWIASSFFLWGVQFSGNVAVTDDQINTFLLQHGIRMGVPLERIDVTEMEKELRRCFPVITWTSIKIKGTGLFIDVKENDVSDPGSLEEHGNFVGMDLISPYDGRIVSMVVREGVPKVKIGQEVKAGQILVEGSVPIYQEDGTVARYLKVEADGDVWVEHVIPIEDAMSFYHVERKFTGRYENRYYFKIGNRYYFFDEGEKYCRETLLLKDETPETMKNLNLPFAFGRITHWEYYPTLEKYGEEEAKELFRKKILQFLSTLEEKGVQIIEKNVKIGTEGEYWLAYGQILVREKADLFREAEEDIDDRDSE